MKFTTSLMIILILTILSVFSRRHKHKHSQPYDPTLGPEVIKTLITKFADPKADKENLFVKCVELVTTDNRSNHQRRKLYENVAKTMHQPKGLFHRKQVADFLSNLKLEVNTTTGNKNCGGHLTLMLLSEPKTMHPSFQKNVRNVIGNIMGISNSKNGKKTHQFITHLVSDRSHNLASPNLLKRLNGGKRRRRRRRFK